MSNTVTTDYKLPPPATSFKQNIRTIASLPEYKFPSSTIYKLPVKSIYYQ